MRPALAAVLAEARTAAWVMFSATFSVAGSKSSRAAVKAVVWAIFSATFSVAVQAGSVHRLLNSSSQARHPVAVLKICCATFSAVEGPVAAEAGARPMMTMPSAGAAIRWMM